MFGKTESKTLTKRGIKKMDAVVTGLILWGIIASIYGLKKADKSPKNPHLVPVPRIEISTSPESSSDGKKHGFWTVLSMLVFGVEKEYKPGIIKRIFSRFSSKWKQ